MAGASDKARFYLEQSVPELREWERREIFTQDEIAAIARKRSDFEHTLNARGSFPSDYARYVDYELNLDMLRRKRVHRLGIKTTAHTGQRKIFSILDRGTRKFHGDIGLWMQYIDYARKQKANKKLNRILTDVLRLHPTKPELWIYAAKYSMEVQADISAARGYLQRGIRFCKSSQVLYVEYAKLELSYIAKLHARQRILGLEASEEDKSSAANQEETAASFIDLGAEADAKGSDQLVVGDTLNETALQQLSSTQALRGAVPIAIFDAAMKQFSSDEALSERFFDMIAGFAQVPCLPRILQHVVEQQLQTAPASAVSLSCQCRLPIVGIPTDSPDFPSALGETLKSIKSAVSNSAEPQPLTNKISEWLRALADDEDLGPELKRVISSTLRKLDKDTVKLPT